ncbi:histidine kinase [Roseivivax halodurans JCM 10272]|uniref:Histidine kinase n=1 Tax=Roseivivax halodurans JCM 10272 TaxID=1449350 RepID=X7EL83_9RHOB|nr:response regulator [Roseivivax halodurans]ETX15883.1 histidine kinase [Roseivivax halodurans JCM 10272]
MKSVLVLEDDVLIALDLAMLVEEAGAKVIGPCHSAATALATASEQRPDLALIDFNLGDHTSEGFADWLAGNGIPYVFLTGHSASQLSVRGENVRILEKPVSTTKLADILEHL